MDKIKESMNDCCLYCKKRLVIDKRIKAFCNPTCRILYHRIENPNYATWKNKNKKRKWMKNYQREYYISKKGVQNG